MRNTYIYAPHPSMRIIGESRFITARVFLAACRRGAAGRPARLLRRERPLPADGGQPQAARPAGCWALRKRCAPPALPCELCAGDIFAYCSRAMPKFHPISISGYHMQARGSQRAKRGQLLRHLTSQAYWAQSVHKGVAFKGPSHAQARLGTSSAAALRWRGLTWMGACASRMGPTEGAQVARAVRACQARSKTLAAVLTVFRAPAGQPASQPAFRRRHCCCRKRGPRLCWSLHLR